MEDLYFSSNNYYHITKEGRLFWRKAGEEFWVEIDPIKIEEIENDAQ